MEEKKKVTENKRTTSSIFTDSKIEEVKKNLEMNNMKKIIGAEDNDKDEETHQPENAPENNYDQMINELKESLADAQKNLQDQKQEVLRIAADFENSKKRLKRESDENIKFANEKLLMEFLPVIDSLEMTLTHAESSDKEQIQSVVKGVDLVFKQFISAFEKCGVEVIAGEKEKFDPNFQEAIATIPTDELAPDHVLVVNRKGFKLNGKLIRPALVTVSQPKN